MKPADLYAKPPAEISTELWKIQPILQDDLDGGCDFDENTRVDIAIYADVSFDGDRGWRLCAVRLDCKPFMIVQQAGRGMDDHAERFITDRDLFDRAIVYLRSLSGGTGLPDDVVDPDADIPGLDEFYGDALARYYADPPLALPHAVGDIVLVRVIEDPHRDFYSAHPKLIETRVRITAVNPRNPTWAFEGTQIDRKSEWIGIGKPVIITHAPGEGSMRARFGLHDIVGPAAA